MVLPKQASCPPFPPSFSAPTHPKAPLISRSRLNATTRKLPSGCAFPANFTTSGLISPRLFLGWRLHNMLSIIAFIGGAAVGGFAVGCPALLERSGEGGGGKEWVR